MTSLPDPTLRALDPEVPRRNALSLCPLQVDLFLESFLLTGDLSAPADRTWTYSFSSAFLFSMGFVVAGLCLLSYRYVTKPPRPPKSLVRSPTWGRRDRSGEGPEVAEGPKVAEGIGLGTPDSP